MLLVRVGVFPDHANAVVAHICNVEIVMAVETNVGWAVQERVGRRRVITHVVQVQTVGASWCPGERGDHPMSVHSHHTDFGVNESLGNPVTDGYRKYDKLGVEKFAPL